MRGTYVESTGVSAQSVDVDVQFDGDRRATWQADALETLGNNPRSACSRSAAAPTPASTATTSPVRHAATHDSPSLLEQTLQRVTPSNR